MSSDVVLGVVVAYAVLLSCLATIKEEKRPRWLRSIQVLFNLGIGWTFLFLVWAIALGIENSGDSERLPGFIKLVIVSMFMVALLAPYLMMMFQTSIGKATWWLFSTDKVAQDPTYDKVDTALKRYEYDAALQMIEAHLQTHAAQPEAWQKLADVRAARGEPQDAVAALARALPLYGRLPEAQAAVYMRMADLYIDEIRQPSRGREILQLLVERRLTERSAHYAARRLQNLD